MEISLMLSSGLSNFIGKIGYVALAVLILLLMITIHELGHYTFGKLLKFKINEFAVGFGKVLWSKQNKSGEKVSLRLIPLGGYCAFEGEDENSNNENAFNNQKPWKRLVVLFGGVLFNFISAILFSIILLALVGSGSSKITELDTANNYSLTQLQVGDVIVEANNEKPTFFNGGFNGIVSFAKTGEPIVVVVERDGKRIEDIVIEKVDMIIDGEVVSLFGISTTPQPLSVGKAIISSVGFTFEMAWECVVLLFKLFTGGLGLSQVGGPVTTISVISEASAKSAYNIVLLLPLIAVNLAVFNLLPIPALDGARMIFVLLEIIRRKPINRELEAKIHGYGLMVLFSLVILLDLLQILVFR